MNAFQNSRTLPVLLLALAASPLSSTSAQQQADTADAFHAPGEGLPVASRAVGLVETDDGRLLAIGPDYKARFDASGFELVPALGLDAPRSMPLTLSLRSLARTSGAPIAAQPAPPCQTGDLQIAWPRAPGLTEHVEITPAGLEHSLRLAAPPAGTGDLVVTFDLDTDLVPAAAPPGATLFFEARVAGPPLGCPSPGGPPLGCPSPGGPPLGCPSPGGPPLGGLTFGGLTGIDADGRRCTGRVRHVDDRIEYVLPASFVDDASYPLLLDPLLGPHFSALGAGREGRHGAGGYERIHAGYLVAWEQVYSSLDTDVYAQRLRAGSGTFRGSAIAVATGAGHRFRPRIAAVRRTGYLLVTWLEGDAGWIQVPRRIAGRAVSMRDGSQGARRQLVSFTDREITSYQVVGERSVADDEAYVLYASAPNSFGPFALGIITATVSTAGGVFSSSSANLANDIFPDFQVSDCIGEGGRWMLLYQAGGQQTIHLRLFDRDGRILFQTMLAGESPELAGNGDEFLVTYDKNNPFAGRTAHYRRMVWTGSTLNVGPERSRSFDPSALTWFHTKVLTARSFPRTDPFERDVRVLPVALDGSGVCGSAIDLGGSGRRDQFRDLAPRWAYGADGDDVGLVVFDSADSAPPFRSDVRVQRIDALGNGGPITNRGGGCGAAGAFTTAGPWALGNPEFAFRLRGSSGSLAVLNLALGASPRLVPCGSCMLMPADVELASLPISGGAATFTTRVFCDPDLLGVQLSAQWLVMVSGAPVCPLVPGIAVSDRLVLQLGE